LIKRKQKLKNIFKDLPIILKIVNWSKQYSPPGFSGVTLHDTITFVMHEIQKDNLQTRANAISFSFFISIFPAIIFLFTLLPLFPVVQDYTLTLRTQSEGLLPKNAHEYIFSIIDDITSIHREGLLSLGAVLALFFSSNGMLTLMSGFDKAYQDAFKPRHWINSRLIAISLTIVMSLLLILSLVIIVVEGFFMDYLQTNFDIPDVFILLFTIINWLISILLIYTGISLIYKYGPSMYRRFPYINVGSVVATLLSLITSFGFSFFINNFGRYNEIYGSIGALIVMLIWIQFNSFILLVGFELNASISVHHIRQKKDKILKLNQKQEL